MCLLTEQEIPLKTEKDIRVFKRLSVSNQKFPEFCEYGKLKPDEKCYYFSFYFGCFEYIPGKMYKIKMQASKVLAYKACPHDDIDSTYYRQNPHKQILEIGKGFHSAESRERILKGSIEQEEIKGSIYEFIIPKGSLIYKDATGLIVSNQIMMVKV